MVLTLAQKKNQTEGQPSTVFSIAYKVQGISFYLLSSQFRKSPQGIILSDANYFFPRE